MRKQLKIGATLTALAILAPTPVYGQEQTFCDDFVVTAAEFCADTWEESGAISAEACWNDLYGSSCPDQHGPAGVIGTRDWRIWWFPVCKTSGMYGRLTYGDCGLP